MHAPPLDLASTPPNDCGGVVESFFSLVHSLSLRHDGTGTADTADGRTDGEGRHACRATPVSYTHLRAHETLMNL
eukprot:1100890-Prymnesium_polylepis.1